MTTSNSTRALRYDVEGMTCGHCQRAIDQEVSEVAGVSSVDVDLDAATVTVYGDDLVEQVVREAILLAGYPARPA